MAESATWLQPLFSALLTAALAGTVGVAALWRICAPTRLIPIARWSLVTLGVGLVCYLWAGAVAMTGAVGAEVPAALRLVLLESHFGFAVRAAGIDWLALVLLAYAPGATRAGSTRQWLFVSGLAIFAWARAVTGHVMDHDQDILGVAVLTQAAHVLASAAWAGTVAVSAWLACDWQAWTADERSALAYRASKVATLAVAVVAGTGILNLVRTFSGTDLWRGSPYVWILGVKLLCATFAVALGAYNRWVGLPRLSRSTDDGGSRFGRVLLIETLVLGMVLLAAAKLGVTMPPMPSA